MQKKFKTLLTKSLRNVEKDIFHEEWLLNSKKDLYRTARPKMDSKVFYLYYIHLNTQKKVFCACMSKAMFVSSSMHTVLIDTLFKIFLVILELLLLVYSTQ